MPPFFNLTSCTPIKYNVHFSIPCTTAYNEPTTETLLTFLVSNIIYIFHGLYHSKTLTPHQILLGHQIKEA
jgi:hypothetical protein